MATTPTPPSMDQDQRRNYAQTEPAPQFDPELRSVFTEELPWHKQFIKNIKEAINPPELPPLELTSKPVAVRDIWGGSAGNEKTAGFTSMLIHGAVIGLLIIISTNETVQKVAKDTAQIFVPSDILPYKPAAPKKADVAGGGGGGGRLEVIPPTKGTIPKISNKQFVPPTTKPLNEQPKLVMEPTIDIQPDLAPKTNLTNIGDPLGIGKLPSDGPGSGAGIGAGKGGGIGSGKGGGLGPGSGGNTGGGIHRIGGGVSAPVLLTKTEPEYSEEARKAKFQGTVVLYIVVDENGMPQNLRVTRPLGLGLDEKAIEAVKRWRFKPSYKDGRPVAVAASVEVNFRLL